MKDFAGRVAVVTGAASGIGFGLARRFAQDGMHIVLADIESEPLAIAEAALSAMGTTTLAVRTDVSSPEQVERLAEAAFSRFGNVHILCNNAGVAGKFSMGTAGWEIPLSEWQWVLGVNLMGVLHGVRAFIPRMVANGEEGHIVNTASIAGLLPGASPYHVAKHGVVCLTEGLYKDFKSRGLRLSASVLCPGWIQTNLMDSERNRPPEFGAPTDRSLLSPAGLQAFEAVRSAVDDGISPADVAEQVFEAVRDDRFYVIPAQPGMREAVKQRMDAVVSMSNPAVGIAP